MILRRFFALLLLQTVCATIHAGTTTRTVSFRSTALDRETTYIAVLPEPLVPGKRYPVLFLLHGAYGGYRDWTGNTSLTEILRYPMIVVTPDGGQFGWYLDSRITPGSNYETLITRDLIADVDSRFPTKSDRSGRGIAGLSMGGHGALSLAAKHPALFTSASSLSGILHLQAHPEDWQLPGRLGRLPEAKAEWARHSVLDLADRFTTANVALLFDTGTSDSAAALPDNRLVHRRLQELGVPHIYSEHPGNHDWTYWREHLPRHLDFHAEAFGLKSAKSDKVD